jgi:hypothetical protein
MELPCLLLHWRVFMRNRAQLNDGEFAHADIIAPVFRATLHP